MDIHNFYIGQAYDAYDYFGVHPAEEGFIFRVYAPRAEKVELIGDFNNWDGSGHVMVQDELSGIYSITVKESSIGDLYKYRIYQEDGEVKDRFDPFGNGSEVRPKTAASAMSA